MSIRTATITSTVALVVLLSTTACKDVNATEPVAPMTSATETAPPSPRPTETDPWVVDSITHHGPKIGSRGPDRGYYVAYCVPKSRWRPDYSVLSEAPSKEIKITDALANTTKDGEPCPPGEEI